MNTFQLVRYLLSPVWQRPPFDDCSDRFQELWLPRDFKGFKNPRFWLFCCLFFICATIFNKGSFGPSEAFWSYSLFQKASHSYVPTRSLPPTKEFKSTNSPPGWILTLPISSNSRSAFKGEVQASEKSWMLK